MVVKKKEDLFTWKRNDGEVIRLPSLQTLDPDMNVLDDVIDALSSENPLVAMSANRRFLISSLPDEYGEALSSVKRMTEFAEMLKAWAEFSGVEVGE